MPQLPTDAVKRDRFGWVKAPAFMLPTQLGPSKYPKITVRGISYNQRLELKFADIEYTVGENPSRKWASYGTLVKMEGGEDAIRNYNPPFC